ncbi:uncharacterized protein LOC103577712 isoform X2 [Microplitis demolitor]|uniref:uncharacterized protein LOC103577712 isoform X2 n=1 Tax=Microplitis demolitor TaxID=69319 RepID=UPI0004CCE39F|nr:uncharacterized protein LOC103577712 isoform X2 [Microplitis demolitor]
MADLCFIRDKSLSEGVSVNVVRGLQTLKTASIEKNDGHIDYLNTLSSVNIHSECRKVYTSKNAIVAWKRRTEEGEPSTPSAPRKKRNEVFDFKKLCLFCGQEANKVAKRKKKEKYRRTISNVSTLAFKENVIKKAEERNDSLGKLVKERILYEYDLIAAEAKYHTICYTNFLTRVPSADKKPRQDDQVTQAMKEIFCYIENNEDSQFTLKELKDVLTEYIPDDKTIITKLQQKLMYYQKLGMKIKKAPLQKNVYVL